MSLKQIKTLKKANTLIIKKSAVANIKCFHELIQNFD